MKLCTYKHNKKTSIAIVQNDKIIDLPSAWPTDNPPQSIKHLLQIGIENMPKLEIENAEKIDLKQVKLLPPVKSPGKILALAGNYSEHIKECGLSLGLSDKPKGDTTPRPFIMPNTVLAGDRETVQWPIFSQQIDHEVELAIIIGKTCKGVSPLIAMNYIAGFTVANDVSARNVTFKQNRAERPWDEFYDWLNGKWADGFLPIGPWIVTTDEIGDVQNLDIELKINGQTRQMSNTKHMIYPVNEIVSFLSNLMTLEPGDVICTGTPAGVGHATGNYLQENDKMECKIQHIGTLTNTIGKKPEIFYNPLKKQD